tara:strand:+ start:96 stop:398 length:303 start_codon:yes stop_codon:yes gene_type:complete
MNNKSDSKIELPKTAKGKRSVFFDDPAIDQLMTFIMELSTEVSVVYDRIDTIERLLDSQKTISRDDIENYRPGPDVEEIRNKRRSEYLRRVFRIHTKEYE